MQREVDACYREAVKVLKRNCMKEGFRGSEKYYNSVWARDGVISLLGSLLTNDKKLMETSRRTLETLRRGQTELGQIPNVIYLGKKRRFSYYFLDSNLWWIIGMHNYYIRTKDENFLRDNWLSLKKAMRNSLHKVIDETGLIDQPEAADWMDSSIGRKGKTLYTNCLFYQALKCMEGLCRQAGEKEAFQDAKHLRRNINILLWPEKEGKEAICKINNQFFSEAIDEWREHYVNYLSFEFFENRCDIFGNILAILFGITDKAKERKIIHYFDRKHITKPYPIRDLWPPILYPNPTWNPKIDLYRKEQNRNVPFCYHNAAIWPFLGGFYVLMLAKAGHMAMAKKELHKLMLANKQAKKGKWGFNEWIHGKTGEPMGACRQSWSAAGYIIAYKAVKGKVIW